MDPTSACRVVVKVPAYFELPCETYHVTKSLKFVVDKDTTSWIDFLADLESKIKHGNKQELHVYFSNKTSHENVEIASDSALLNAFYQYWDIRSLTLEAIVHDIDELDNAIVPCTDSVRAPTCIQDPPSTATTTATIIQEEGDEEQVNEIELLGPNYVPEYVGFDDEGLYLDGNNDDATAQTNVTTPINGVSACTDVVVVPNVVIDQDGEGGEKEEEGIDDADWEGTKDDNVVIPIVVHDKENPVMRVGSTFPNIHEFRLAICQYTIKKEFEFNLDKSEPGRFRAHCAAEGCKWYIYAKAMIDKTTFQVRRHRVKHNCASTQRLEKSKNATQAWICERVMDWLRKDATLGASELERRLHEKYHIHIPYKRVHAGRSIALDKLYGCWEDSFEKLYSFKAEVEKRCPGSIVAIDTEEMKGKQCFRRVFVALKPCVDGFLNGCRPFLSIDSSVLTGKFRG